MGPAPNDADLIEASRRGDVAAFGAIVARYQAAVCAVSYSKTRDRALGDDIAQDTFLSAWGQLGALRDPDRLPAWLCGIARNLARLAVRRRAREAPLENREPVAATTPYDELSERESEQDIAEALARVPEAYREPLVMFYCEQQPARDIARALGISEDSVHQRLSRGRRHLAGDIERAARSGASRRRRDLSAAVIAMIALGGAASPVEAATPYQGFSMWKIGLIATAIAAIAGTGYVVKQSNAEATRPGQATPTAAAGTVSPVIAETPSQIIAGGFSVSPAIAQASQQRGPAPSLATNIVVDCKAAGRRYGELMTQAQQDSLDEVETKHGADIAAGIPSAIGSHFASKCETEGWSNEAIRCVLDAGDMVTAGICLRSVKPALAAQPEAASPFGMPWRTVPAANLSVRSCAAVAKHMYDLMTPSPEAIAQIPTDMRAAALDGFTSAKGALLAEIETSCEAGAWADAARRCVLQATSGAVLGPCFDALPTGVPTSHGQGAADR